jgi:hypothetical protein
MSSIIKSYERMIGKGLTLTPIQQAEYDKARAALAAEQIPAEQSARSGELPAEARAADIAAPPRKAHSPLWWFPVDAQSWLDDDRIEDLNDRQRGWLFILRLQCWRREGRVSSDTRRLMRLARVTDPEAPGIAAEFQEVIASFFSPTGEGEVEETTMRQLYLEKLQNHKEASENGRKGGLAKAATRQ